jgi:hypothetical protein
LRNGTCDEEEEEDDDEDDDDDDDEDADDADDAAADDDDDDDDGDTTEKLAKRAEVAAISGDRKLCGAPTTVGEFGVGYCWTARQRESKLKTSDAAGEWVAVTSPERA